MRTILGVAFIAVVAVGATVAWFTPTVARGAALAEVIFETNPHRVVTCDDVVPITAIGAAFQCRATGDDGSTAVFALTIDRTGAVHTTVMAQTPATHAPPAKAGDPWNR